MNEPILVIEDDPSINSLLCEALAGAGYRPESSYSGSEAVMMLPAQSWKCVILDLMLPGRTGEDVLDELRKKEHMPVIVLSAKMEKASKLELLARGADDYMTKPFDIDELLARVAAQLRRYTVYAEHEAAAALEFLDIHMILETREVSVGGVTIQLTQREFDILELLLRHPQKVFSRMNIYESIWNEEFMGDEKTINVHVSNLRAKLHAASPHKHIKTIWGVGFRLVE
ncbi:response regulator transcription factor [Paenibacillus kobensis]|uniref:response regulator transcription factor n=1 Tax=Paenibacillus kobensis TaxID=59841 RepID=UPI000FD8B16A|nr:response regulator transcription factor [Paenibacillus kobensis]